MIRNRLHLLGSILAALLVVGVPAELRAQTCQVPLPIVRTVGEAKVLIVFDTSGSMNEPVYHDDYDDTVAWTGNFNSGINQYYYVANIGDYDPKDFNNSWPNTPTAKLVDSDGGDDGWYPGRYLNWVYFHATAAQRAAIPTQTRIQVAKQVINSVLGGGSTNTSFGVMIFNGDDGGQMLSPIGTPIATIQSAINGVEADTYTPLAETMEDALTYFKLTTASAPLKASCEKPFIVLVTDGHPTQDVTVSAYLRDADGVGPETTSCAALGAPFPESYNCSSYLDDVIYYMQNNDMRADLAGNQNVTTYVVGFNITAWILDDAAADGGGGPLFSVKNAAQMTAALLSALSDIDKKVSAGTAVSVVSAEDQTDNRLYRARFESVSWKGFVEGFDLPYTTGDSPVWEAGALLEARSASSRNIYTSSTGTNKVDFTAANAATLQALLGAVDVAEATNIINYVRGTDLTGYRDRDEWKLGDIVDSSPIAVGNPSAFYDFLSYPSFRSGNYGRTEVLYVGANDGTLHCFRTSNGNEEWAYVPKNQLGKVKNLMSPSYCHQYFVNMTPAVYDMYVGGNWKTVLIGGNERGGSGLFALDVTNPGSMQVMWDVNIPALKGSWNRPALIRDKTLNKFVLCAPTGFDSTSGTSSILVIDPADGSVLSTWNMGTAYAGNMATTPSALDKNFDGFDDLMYVGDLAGRVWRFDLTGNPWTVTQLFSDTRPIQATPVLTMDEAGRVLVYFGTGRYIQTSDLTTTSSQSIYALFDNHGGTTLTRGNLVNQTSTFTALNSSDKGWYFDLVQYSGERITRSAALIGGNLYFPSFRPKSGACQSGGESWLYSLDYGDGSYPDNQDGSENNTTTGRVEAMGDGILSNPAVDLVNEDIIMQNSNTSMITKNINANLQRMTVRSWRQKWN